MYLLVINDEMLLHDRYFHCSKELFPIAIFYEGDHRDNLDEHLSDLDKVLRSQPPHHRFDLAGDKMFLEGMLDGKRELGPTKEEGWNIFFKTSIKKHSQLVCPSGLRT